VQDLAYVDGDARTALFGFFGSHGAQIDRIVLHRTAESDLLYRLDPGRFETSVDAGPMVRLTGLKGLETIAWPAVELELRLAVTDPLLGDGTYRLSVADGVATIEADAGEPDATVGIGALSQLAVGTHGVERAVELGGLAVEDDKTRSALSELFRPRAVGLREFF